MQRQITTLDFKGQNIFVGIDVHLKSWTVTILTEELMHKTFTQPACAETLCNYLKRNFPGGDYNSVYEAGFSGFWAHYKLKEMGINNIVPIRQMFPLRRRNICRKTIRQIAGSLPVHYVP